MLKSSAALFVALLALASAAPAAVVGKDARVCMAGKSAMLVRVNGFKKAGGTVKVAVYAAQGYLAKGGKLRKVEVPVRSTAAMDICIAVPKAGRYSIAVHHDMNGNGDKDPSDGGGYSRNPKLSLTNLRPAFARTAVQVGASPRAVPVTLLYRSGLSLKPASS